jgi:hypothetical protein
MPVSALKTGKVDRRNFFNIKTRFMVCSRCHCEGANGMVIS